MRQLDSNIRSCFSLAPLWFGAAGFQVCHSLGGGTGSGMGTLLISKIREEYPGESQLFRLGIIWLNLTYAQGTTA